MILERPGTPGRPAISISALPTGKPPARPIWPSATRSGGVLCFTADDGQTWKNIGKEDEKKKIVKEDREFTGVGIFDENPKTEIRNPNQSEIPMTESESHLTADAASGAASDRDGLASIPPLHWDIGISDLFRISDFGFRISYWFPSGNSAYAKLIFRSYSPYAVTIRPAVSFSPA